MYFRVEVTFGIPIVPSGFLTGVTSTESQAMGASAAANIRWTDAAISGPCEEKFFIIYSSEVPNHSLAICCHLSDFTVLERMLD
jgi:hypothetical protein